MPDTQQFTQVFAQISLWAVVLAFFLGALSTLTPATFALAPVVVGYVGASAHSRPAGWGRALAFLGGLTLVNVAMGAFFGAAGALAQEVTGGNLALWNGLAGLLTLVIALSALGVVRLPLPTLATPIAPSSSWAGAFTLGLPFGLVSCPTCMPVMVPVALGAAATGTAWYGGLLFLAFAVGRGLPLLLIGGMTGFFKGLRGVSRYIPAVERASALLLLLAGLYFLSQAVWWMLWRMAM